VTAESDEVLDNVPRPLDDGAADHLVGMPLPEVILPSTHRGRVNLAAIGPAVLFCYPRTARPGVEPPGGLEAWNAIPGARGCTGQACSYRDHHAAVRRAGYAVFGVSTQSPAYQREAVRRLGLPYPLLSDERLHAAAALRLPTFTVADVTLLKRLTLICRDGVIVHVRYPVFPADRDAGAVVDWLANNAGAVG
jgi:peroxiredoxin